MCVCVFVWIQISLPRIYLLVSNFARWFGVLCRESHILGNFAPPEAQNRTNWIVCSLATTRLAHPKEVGPRTLACKLAISMLALVLMASAFGPCAGRFIQHAGRAQHCYVWIYDCSQRWTYLLSTHANRQVVDISFTVCLFVCLKFCTVTDFSGEDKASGIKFYTVVQGYYVPESLILGNFAPQKPKIRWIGHPAGSKVQGGKSSHIRVPINMARRVDVGSACVDIWPSPKMDVLVIIIIIVIVVVIIVVVIIIVVIVKYSQCESAFDNYISIYICGSMNDD